MNDSPDTPLIPAAAKNRWPWIALIVILALSAAVRWRLADFPLERDEGEYAYAGQLILQGIPPYRLAYNMKFPGVYAAYALIMAVFGESTAGIHLGIIVVNSANIVLLFFLTRRLWNSHAAVLAAATYALMSTDQGSLGISGHATHFVVLPMLAGLLFLLTAIERDQCWRVFVAGILFDFAVLMKQPGIFFAAFGLLWLAVAQWQRGLIRWKRLMLQWIVMSAGVAIPLVLTGLILWKAGVFDRFWFWTIDYARMYGSEIPISEAPAELRENFYQLTKQSYLLWALAGVGLLLGFIRWQDRRRMLFLLPFTIFSFFAVSVGFYFRQHYFILLMPAAAILVGAGLDALGQILGSAKVPGARALPGLLLGLVIGFVAWTERDFLFFWKLDVASRQTYGLNPFVASQDVAKYLADHTSPEETIAVIGSEPEIYFDAKRHSATGYIYMYGLMENQPYAMKMQQEMAREIEQSRPSYLVFIDVDASWLMDAESDKWILKWFVKYRKGYEQVGMIDLFMDRTEYHWDADAAGRARKSPYYVQVFRRKSGT